MDGLKDPIPGQDRLLKMKSHHSVRPSRLTNCKPSSTTLLVILAAVGIGCAMFFLIDLVTGHGKSGRAYRCRMPKRIKSTNWETLRCPISRTLLPTVSIRSSNAMSTSVHARQGRRHG
jgi:hypothetical protein